MGDTEPRKVILLITSWERTYSLGKDKNKKIIAMVNDEIASVAMGAYARLWR
jgi:hypothetical protein